MEYIEENVDYSKITSFADYLSSEWTSYIIDLIMEMPSVKEALNDKSAKTKKLMSDVNKLKDVANDWMAGLQYIEISEHLNIGNVDDVKTAYCKEHQVISCASVDGLSEKNEKLLFVEIKGWVDFLQYQEKNAEKKIEKQVSGYDFIKKLKDRAEACYNGWY